MNQFIEKAKLVLTKPSKFFEGVKKEEGVQPAFTYFAVISLVNLVLGTAASYLFLRSLLGTSVSLPTLIVSYVISLLFAFVVAGILHVWIKLFRGKGNYAKTFQLYVYSDTPKMLIGWIPFIGSLIGSVYGLILLIIGGEILHGFSRRRSIFVFVIPAVIVIVLAVLALIGSLAFLTLMPGLSSQ